MMKSNTTTPEGAEATGFATFNNVPHICIDVPDGNHTITLKTSEGKLLTVALLPYETGGAPQCVDVVSHAHAGLAHTAHPQDIRVFNKGLIPYSHVPTDDKRDDAVKENPPVITSIILLPTK